MCFSLSEKAIISFVLFSIHKNRTSSSEYSVWPLVMWFTWLKYQQIVFKKSSKHIF